MLSYGHHRRTAARCDGSHRGHARLFQKYGRERSVEDAGARYTYGCSSAAEFHRRAAPGFTLLHDVPFTSTIARYHPVLAPLVRLPLVGRLSERIVVLRAPA